MARPQTLNLLARYSDCQPLPIRENHAERGALFFLDTPDTEWPCFSPKAESFGVSAQIGSGPEVRFHEGSTRVPPGFHEGSTRFCKVLRGLWGGASTKKRTVCCWLYHLSLFSFCLAKREPISLSPPTDKIHSLGCR